MGSYWRIGRVALPGGQQPTRGMAGNFGGFLARSVLLLRLPVWRACIFIAAALLLTAGVALLALAAIRGEVADVGYIGSREFIHPVAALILLAAAGMSYVLFRRDHGRYARVSKAGVRSEARYLHCFEANPRPVWIFDEETLRVIAANHAACREYGYTAAEFRTLRVTDLYVPGESTEFADALVSPGREAEQRWTHVHSDGSRHVVEVTSSLLEFAGRRARMVFIVDVTARLHDAELAKLAAMAFANVSEAVAVLGARGRFETVNRAFESLTGYVASEVAGRSAHFFVLMGFRQLLRTLADVGQFDGEVWCRRKNDTTFLVQLSIRVAHTQDGMTSHYVVVAHDLSAQRVAEASIHSLAFHDSLTGLPNRNLLEDRARQAIATHERNHGTFAVLFIDLDNFKSVNDTLGHLAGDLLLQAAGRCVVGSVQEADTAARWGGDEFVVLLPFADLEVAGQVAARILGSLELPATINNQLVALGASIGVALYPKDGADFQTLLRSAGIAMHQAKDMGRNRWHPYSLPTGGFTNDRVALAGALRRALNSGEELEVHYQPEFDLITGEVVGFEALARWNSPQLGWVPPDKFIPVAETNGDINALGDWILAQACRDLEALSLGGYGRARMAVNVSAVQLRDDHFAERCLNTIRACGASTARIELEVTESMLLQDRDAVVRQLRQLREHGVSIAIDDFGTGFSSLSYLQHLPMDKVKIDRSFITSMNRDVDARAIVRVIVGLAHSLQVRCLAEGVESEDTRRALAELGCDQAQGFLLAPPMALPQLLAWLGTRGPIAAPRCVARALPLVEDRPERRTACRVPG